MAVAAAISQVPFHVPFVAGGEEAAIAEVFRNGTFQGDGVYTRRCHEWFMERYGCAAALMTPSCSLALDMALLLSGVGPGDDVLIPDYTFVSTAQSVALRGAVPVFCDVRADNLNIDEARLEEAITPRTKAIMPVHYAGVGADMAAIRAFADRHGLMIIEDAAQAIGATDEDKPIGTSGAMSAFSFHASKNIQCGEGGMLVVNDPDLVDAAYIAWEKGTNRHAFLSGKVDKYNWIDLGSSFLSNEMTAAMLAVQLEAVERVTQERRTIWQRYHEAFQQAERDGHLCRLNGKSGGGHNGHLYAIILPDAAMREAVQGDLKTMGVQAVPHYPALHESEGGRRFGRPGMSLDVSSDLSKRLLRLPLFAGLKAAAQDHVISSVLKAVQR